MAAACVILGVAIVYVDSAQDDNAPTITVGDEPVVYQEGAGTKDLLAGVKAEDKEDGDLTKEVFVEKIVPVKDNKAIVYYGVLDKHQNVGTATKEVEYLTGDAQTGGDVRHCSLQPAVQMFRSEDRLIQWDILHQCQMIRTVRRL